MDHPDTRRPLVCLYLHLTMRCNLRCSYCYGLTRDERMTWDVGRDAIDFFMDRADELHLQFIGGEPMLESTLLKRLVDHAEQRASERARVVRFCTVTNGTLLNEEFLDWGVPHEMEYSLSLDGDRRAHDTSRVFVDGRGSFDGIEPNLEGLLKRNPWVHVISVVNPDNVARLVDSVQYLLEKGVRSIELSGDYRHPKFREALPEIEERYVALGRMCAQRLMGGERFTVSLFDVPGNNPYARPHRCQLGQVDFSVDPLADIYPCCCFVDHRAFRLGSVREGFDPQAWAAFEVSMDELETHLHEDHADCPETSACRKGCGCTNIVLSKAMSPTDRLLCEYGRVVDRARKAFFAEFARGHRAGIGGPSLS